MAGSCTTPEAQLILIAQRIGGDNVASYTIYKFSFSHSSLSPILSLPAIEFPYHMGFFCVNTVIYMVGGVVHKKGKLEACKEVWELQLSSLKIKRVTSMSSGKSYPTCIGPLEDGLVYVFSSNLSSHACESFNPKTCMWNPLPPPPVPLDVNVNSNDSEIVDHRLSSSSKTIVITTKCGGKFNFRYDLHVWDSCNEEPPVLTSQIPELMENLSFEVLNIDRAETLLLYRTDNNGSKPVVGYPPSGAHLFCDPAAYLFSLGNRRFCTFRSGYEARPFQDPYSKLKVCVKVFSLKEEMREVKVDEEEVSVSLEIEESPYLWLHIRGCFALLSHS